MTARRLLLTALCAFGFGLAAGLLAGDGPGLHAGLSNLSAPWLLVALLAALPCATLPRGAAVGLAATLTALMGFYVAKTLVLSGHNGGGGFLAELRVESTANRVYFVTGLVTGPLLGAAGAWLGRRAAHTVWLVAGTLLVAEIVVVAAVQGRQLLPAPLYFSWGVADWRPYLAEAAVGVAVLVAGLRGAIGSGRWSDRNR